MTIPKELTTVTLVSRIVELIVLVAAMIISFGLGVNYQETIDLLKQQNNQAPSIISKPIVPNTDETADWKTYINEKYGFSLKYPQELTIKEDTSEIDINFPKDPRGIPFFKTILIRINNITPGISIKQAISKGISGLGSYDSEALPSKPITLGGIDGLYYDSAPAGYAATDAFIIKGNKLWSFRLNTNTGNNLTQAKEDKSLFDQILSTFKFTSP